MWLFLPKPKKSICDAFVLCSNDSKNITWKSSQVKCEFFCNEINYLAHYVSKDGVWPSKENMKAMDVFTWPQTYTKIQAFLGLECHYWQFIKGFACVAQLLHKHLSGEGAGKKNEWVPLTSNVQVAFGTLKEAFSEAPVLAFANFDKPFLLETDSNK